MTDQPLEPPEPGESRSSGPAAAQPLPPAATATTQPRRLRRSRDDRVIAGVCGGIGRYFDVDPVLVRIAAVVLIFAGGAGLVLYLIGWIAIPEEEGEAMGPAREHPSPPERGRSGVALGVLFVLLGAFFLADEIWPDLLAWKYVWPIALIVVGAVVILRARR